MRLYTQGTKEPGWFNQYCD